MRVQQCKDGFMSFLDRVVQEASQFMKEAQRDGIEDRDKINTIHFFSQAKNSLSNQEQRHPHTCTRFTETYLVKAMLL